MAIKVLGSIPLRIECYSGVVSWIRGWEYAGNTTGGNSGFDRVHGLDDSGSGDYSAAEPSSTDYSANEGGIMLSVSPSKPLEGRVWAGKEGADSGISESDNLMNGFNVGTSSTLGFGDSEAKNDDWVEEKIKPFFDPSMPKSSTSTLELDVPEDMLKDVENVGRTIEVAATQIWKDNGFRIANAFAQFGKAELEIPETWQRDSGPDDEDYTAYGTVTVNPGTTSETFGGKVTVFFDEDTGSLYPSMREAAEDADDQCLLDALDAQEAFDQELARGVRYLDETGDSSQLPSNERPAATSDDCLGGNVDHFDKWWNNVSTTLSRVKSESSNLSTDDKYDEYVEGGGELSKDEWLNDVYAGVEDTVTSDTVSDSSWLTSILDGAEWLGGETFDLLKSWGPMGTVGAYAGLKTTNATSGSTLAKIAPFAIIGGLIWLLSS